MLQHDLGPIRNLGRIAMTAGVKKSLSGEDLMHALLRHIRGITPDCEFPRVLDNLVGCRVLKVYRSSAGRPFWIITEPATWCFATSRRYSAVGNNYQEPRSWDWR